MNELSRSDYQILAIDIGGVTGWAVRDSSGTVHSGSENIADIKNVNKFLRFTQFLRQFIEKYNHFHLIVYEGVMAHAGVNAAHAYGGYVAQLECWSELNNLPLCAVGVTQLKKFAAGHGHASKTDMIVASRKAGVTNKYHHDGWMPKDSNEADAVCLLWYAEQYLINQYY